MRVPVHLWINYPFSKAADFINEDSYIRRWRTKAHVLHIGPIAFAVIWRTDARSKKPE